MIVSETAKAGMLAMAVNIRKYVAQKQLQSQKSAVPSPAPSVQRAA